MKKSTESGIEKILFVSSLVSLSTALLIFGFMIVFGLPLFEGGRFFSLIRQSWSPHEGAYGILPMIAGTFVISCLAVVFAFPLSLGCSSFISVLGHRRLAWGLRKTVQFMTGIPTVIYGFVGIFLLVPFVRQIFQGGSGQCVLTASLMLALLISPTMILLFIDSFEQVPRSYLSAAEAMGATPVQKLIYIILPCARTHMLTGFILSFARALGDTLIALMLAGNALQIPSTILDSARTLTAHIALVIAADFESPEFKSIFACGIILYLFTACIVLILRRLEKRNHRR